MFFSGNFRKKIIWRNAYSRGKENIRGVKKRIVLKNKGALISMIVFVILSTMVDIFYPLLNRFVLETYFEDIQNNKTGITKLLEKCNMTFETYIEPFLGSGAIFYNLEYNILLMLHHAY